MRQASTTLTETKPSEAPKELEVNGLNSQSREQTVKELEKPTEDLTRQSTSAIATTSGRMDEGQYQDNECYELYSETVNSYESSSVAEGSRSGKRTGSESSTVVKSEVDSNPKRIALDEYYPAQSLGMWIFPDNTRQLCVTTAGKQVIESVGDHHREAETRQVYRNSSEPEVEEKVVRVAVILGFGVLVLLTRQREPRKKQRGKLKVAPHTRLR